ncbi:MAG: hypothetical protein JNK68_02990 [Betaproteobacteria bacterium]|nr:hypothetical protein [Betaproteobacteria bacterium]
MSEVMIKALWIYGLAIVVSLAVAVVIKLIVVILGALERKPAAAPKPAAAVPAPALDVVADHVAAISAAVYAMLGAHRIVHIEEQRQAGWVVEGRLAHHTSHAIQHHPKQ